MSIEEAVKKYFQLIRTEHFTKYEKDFAYKLQLGLINGCRGGFYEPIIVAIIKSIVNKLDGLSLSDDGFRISTKSIFIHGNKSQVEFEYYNQRIQRELGDLIFILSVIYNGKKYFEKFTISQFKKSDDRLRWNLSNKGQIYLLSRFPPFRGIKGSIIPMKEFYLPNYSKCLGSFNLIFNPGDFIFISAQLLENLVGNKKSVDIVDVSKLWELEQLSLGSMLFDKYLIKELFHVWRKYGAYTLMFPSIGILGFSHYSPNIHDFIDKYLRGCVGELIYSEIGIYNKPALDFLHELLSVIEQKGKKEERKEFTDFVKEFFIYSYSNNEGGRREGIEFDYEGGGIGIIYTSINLGEGKR
jgi:hypothetical protein